MPKVPPEAAPPAPWLPLLRGAGLGLFSGLLLFLCDAPYAFWPLAFFALTPFWAALLGAQPGRVPALLAGLGVGLGQAVPLLATLNFPAFAILGFTLYYALVWGLAALALRWALHPAPSWPRLVLGAAVLALADTLACALLPIWGTAQSFSKTLSNAPFFAQPAALFGQTGLTFFCALVSALLAGTLFFWRRERPRAWRALGGLLLAWVLYLGLAGGLWTFSQEKDGPTLRVAAIGWNRGRVRIGEWADPERLFREHYRPLLDQAVAAQATLILTPEFGANLSAWQRARFLPQIADYARRHAVWLALAYFDKESDTNRVQLFDPQGRPVGEPYLKTHLIATVEEYRPGPGALKTARIGEFTVGMMICQDDNYLDLARGYGALGVDLLLVPTNDWAEVKDLHFANSRIRPIENRYSLLRAALDGYTALVDSQGTVVARRDTERDDRGLVVGTIRKPAPGLPFPPDPRRFPAVLLVLVLAVAIRRARAPRLPH